MHAVLRLVLLQDDFLDAYKNGIEFVCNDGVTRHLFPRYMIYSADYPERQGFLSYICSFAKLMSHSQSSYRNHSKYWVLPMSFLSDPSKRCTPPRDCGGREEPKEGTG